MRDIKFRAWSKSEKIIIEDVPVWKNKHCHLPDDKNNFFELSECVLMQYIGIEDKNEVEIYEGDICSYENYKGIVKYYHLEFECLALNHEGLDVLHYKQELIEVIGNIYQNPDLI